MAVYTFTVPGKPFGKQRPRVTRTGHAFTPETTVSYENLVRMTFVKKNPEVIPADSPVRIEITAQFPVPASWSKKKRAAALAGKIFQGKPDWDNIGKIITDAMNNIAYKDDAQVHRAVVDKRYSEAVGVSVELIIEEMG